MMITLESPSSNFGSFVLNEIVLFEMHRGCSKSYFEIQGNFEHSLCHFGSPLLLVQIIFQNSR